MKGDLLNKMNTAYTSRTNACRTIRRLVKRTPGVALDIPISACEVHVKLRKPIRAVKVHWPVLSMKDWVHYMVSRKPELLLAGNSFGSSWRQTFVDFWNDYKAIDGTHPIFAEDFELGACIPYHLHGDEGRGQLRRPYLVLSWQCLIGQLGAEKVNDTSFLGVACDWFQFCLGAVMFFGKYYPCKSNGLKKNPRKHIFPGYFDRKCIGKVNH